MVDSSLEAGSDTNPYRRPKAVVADVQIPVGQGELLAEPNRLSARRGIAWWSAGWRLFRQSPAVWIGIALVAFIIEMLLALTPVLGIAALIFVPTLMGGIMVGARELDRQRDLSVAHLFTGFALQWRALIVLGVLYFAATFLIDVLMLVGLVQGEGRLFLLRAAIRATSWRETALLFVILVIVLSSIALFGVMSLASTLVILQRLRPLHALELGYRGCLRNIAPMFVAGLVGLVLAVVASIPWWLGWLILGPMIYTTLYSSYTDIFLQH
jgi:uncharacterized membrane protein